MALMNEEFPLMRFLVLQKHGRIQQVTIYRGVGYSFENRLSIVDIQSSLFVRDLATHAPSFTHVLFALRTRTPLLPAALASVPFGFVLARVRVSSIRINVLAEDCRCSYERSEKARTALI